MEVGFYHPDRGYWQATNEPSAEIRATYPDGTIEVPLIPGQHYAWISGQWVEQPKPIPTVPVTVTMRQARLALLASNMLSGVDAAIAAMPSPQREQCQIEWQYASEVRRDSPLIIGIGGSLGLTDDQINALFTQAATL